MAGSNNESESGTRPRESSNSSDSSVVRKGEAGGAFSVSTLRFLRSGCVVRGVGEARGAGLLLILRLLPSGCVPGLVVGSDVVRLG